MADVTMIAGAVLALAFPGILVVAAACDVARYLIPNALSIALVGALVPAALVAGLPAESILYHVLAGAAVFGVGFVLFAFKTIGGGDVKLLAAAAVWTGWNVLGSFLIAVAIVGGFIALTLLAVRLVWPGSQRPRGGPLGRLMSPKQGVPYASAIALAGLAVTPRMPLLVPLFAIFGFGKGG